MLKEISIPNGMEFYTSCDYSELYEAQFQFPTGWNSTVIEFCKFSSSTSFNSQRDGILQKDSFYAQSGSSTFQFPTGWNST